MVVSNKIPKLITEKFTLRDDWSIGDGNLAWYALSSIFNRCIIFLSMDISSFCSLLSR